MKKLNAQLNALLIITGLALANPVKAQDIEPPFRLVGKALKASQPEIEQNIRARSAVMRVLERRPGTQGEAQS